MSVIPVTPTSKQNTVGGLFTIFLAAFFWGTTFVAQQVGMDYINLIPIYGVDLW